MTEYQNPDDLKSIPAFAALAPVEANAFLAFNHAVERKDGLIPPKYRELISLAGRSQRNALIASTCIRRRRRKLARRARRWRKPH